MVEFGRVLNGLFSLRQNYIMKAFHAAFYPSVYLTPKILILILLNFKANGFHWTVTK